MKNILVTGAFGQIGSELVPALIKKHGEDHVVALGHSNIPGSFEGILEQADVMDKKALENIIKKYHIDTVYHLVSILSAKGEQNPHSTWDINMLGLKYILDLAIEHKLKVFWPSSIAAFGPTTPTKDTPNHTILEPTTMYGVTKVAGELLCQYYFLKFDVDVRSVRYPGIISAEAEPGGGTTDYAVAIFYSALEDGNYKCYLRDNSALPMMYIDDAIKATLDIMDAPADKIKNRLSYNLAAYSVTPASMASELQKRLHLTISYEPDFRQNIADSWPDSIDDSEARTDWGWDPSFDLTKTVEIMLQKLRKKLKK